MNRDKHKQHKRSQQKRQERNKALLKGVTASAALVTAIAIGVNQAEAMMAPRSPGHVSQCKIINGTALLSAGRSGAF